MTRTPLLAALALLACAPPPLERESTADATGAQRVVFDALDGTSSDHWIAGLGAPRADLAAASGSVHERVLAVRVAFADAPTLCSAKEAQATLLEDVADHLAVVTEGRRTLDGDVVGPFVVPRGQGCDLATWQTNALAAARDEGIDPDAYDRWMFLMPPIPCAFAGAAFVNGPSSFINGPNCRSAPVLLHELGHNFGLLHAATPTYEYGDRSDPMGAANGTLLRGFHAAHSIALGSIDAHEIEEVGGDRRGPISALASSFARRAPKILRVATPRSPQAFYVSFRAGTAWDATLPTEYRDRVSVHSVPNAPGPRTTTLLASLASGETFRDDTTGLEVTARPSVARQADVEVRFDCRAAPLRLRDVRPQWIRPGAETRMTITIEDHDGVGCAPRGITPTVTTNARLEFEVHPPTLTVAPGEDASFALLVRASDGTPEGPWPVTLTVDDANDVFDVVIDATPPTPPSALSAIVYAPNAVRVSWSTSFDEGPDVRYELLRDGVVVHTTEPWDPSRPVSVEDKEVPPGTHRYAARAIDRAGNVSAISGSIAVAVP